MSNRSDMYLMIERLERYLEEEEKAWHLNPNKITWDQLTPLDYGHILDGIDL